MGLLVTIPESVVIATAARQHAQRLGAAKGRAHQAATRAVLAAQAAAAAAVEKAEAEASKAAAQAEAVKAVMDAKTREAATRRLNMVIARIDAVRRDANDPRVTPATVVARREMRHLLDTRRELQRQLAK